MRIGLGQVGGEPVHPGQPMESVGPIEDGFDLDCRTTRPPPLRAEGVPVPDLETLFRSEVSVHVRQLVASGDTTR